MAECVRRGCSEQVDSDWLLCDDCVERIPNSEQMCYGVVCVCAQRRIVGRWMHQYLGMPRMDFTNDNRPLCESCEEDQCDAPGLKLCRGCLEWRQKLVSEDKVCNCARS
jgi:hypothetical protein